MKELVVKEIEKHIDLSKKEIEDLIEIPPSKDLGDYAFPCFILSKTMKMSPDKIAIDLSKKISSKSFESVVSKGPYLNFFLNRNALSSTILSEILKKKEKYGSSNIGKGKTIVIDMSSPNIAKPFGIGHLRSTIIGDSVSNLCKFNGYKVVKINYLGDWGTQFGKLIVGYKKFGSESKLKKDPINHLLEIYVKVSSDESLEEASRQAFKELENGNPKYLSLWKKFKSLSLKQFNEIYKILGTNFDVISGESLYNKKMSFVIKDLEKKGLLQKSDGAMIVNLEKYNLGVVLIQKSDGATLYTTRDLAAAIDRRKKYKAEYLLYEVGSEQRLHFRQMSKILELMGYTWAKNIFHIDHGLYLGKDGKKFATRKGKTVFMSKILKETIALAKKEISKREKLPSKELEKRALIIAKSAIFYGDLKNYRSNDVVFDIQRFLDFEGNTGPYLLYTYARASSILRKVKKNKTSFKINEISDKEKEIILLLSQFPNIVSSAYEKYSPNLVANYAYEISKNFNEFYHSEKVIGSESEAFRVSLIRAFSQILKNSLSLLGIQTLEKM